MGQLKKIKNLLDSYEKLPNGSFKKAVGDDMEKIKELYAEIHSLKKINNKLDYKYEHNQLNELEEKDVNTH